MARHKHLAAWLLLGVMGVSACGGSKGSDAEKGAKTPDEEALAGATPDQGTGHGTGGTPTTSVGGAGAPEAGGPGASGSGSAAGGGSASASSEQKEQPPVPLQATLGSSCVKAGGTQSIKATTLGRAGIGYDSYYSDGKSGIDKDKGFYGGNNGTTAGPDGQYQDTWVISAHAPPGTVRVIVQSVAVRHKAAQMTLTFELVGPAGVCP